MQHGDDCTGAVFRRRHCGGAHRRRRTPVPVNPVGRSLNVSEIAMRSVRGAAQTERLSPTPEPLRAEVDSAIAKAARRHRRLPLLKRAEDLRPAVFALCFVLYQSLVFFVATGPLEALLLVAVPHFVLQVPLMNVQHISIHHRIFRSRILELVFGAMCTLSLGFTRSCFALDHLTHHRHYLDPSLDTNAWQGDKGALRRHRYALRHLRTVYPRTWKMARNEGARVAREYLAECAAVLVLCALLLLAKPVVTLAVFVYPMTYNILATYYWAHHQHADLDTRDPLAASRTFDNRLFNWLSFNVGYHAAHHYRPGVHWSRLPALHETLRHRMPAELTLHSIPWLSSEYGPRRPKPVEPSGIAAKAR